VNRGLRQIQICHVQARELERLQGGAAARTVAIPDSPIPTLKSRGKGCQSRINAILRREMLAADAAKMEFQQPEAHRLRDPAGIPLGMSGSVGTTLQEAV
jgi:hypothetical protein